MQARNYLKRSPIVPFVVLAYTLPIPILLYEIIDLPFELLLIYASWTPNIAAFVVIKFILREDKGMRTLIAGWGKWNVGPGWYIAAISPILISFLTVAVYLIFGGETTDPGQPILTSILLSIMVGLITGALGEELGWRGFLLPRLQQRYNASMSSLIVGLIWALWHLPLWLLPGLIWAETPFWTFALGVVSISVLMTWVLNNTNGSLVMASLIHLSMNVGLSLVGILGLMPSPGDYWQIAAFLFSGYAILIIYFAGYRDLSSIPLTRLQER